MLAHVPSFGRNFRGSPDFLAYPVPKACMHVLGTWVPRCLGVARSASSPKAVQALGCSLTPGLQISFGQVTCMARAASVPGLWTLGFLLLRGACVWVWVVVGFGFRLRPATPGWGVGVCARLCVRSACTLPLLAGVCGVGVCGWVRVPAAPRHSWLGCRGLCLLAFALRLHPATPGWGVRCGCVWLGSGSGCAPPLLAGVSGFVSACVRAPLAPRHSWLGCAVWVCVFGLGFQLRPAAAGWGVGVFLCWCACSSCTPPLLAGVCGLAVCPWARVLAAPRHSWLGCSAVCVPVCALRLHPATPGWGARCGCVCLGSGFGCAPPLLAGVLGCVCARVRAPLAPCNSWLGCAVWVCVFWLGFWLRPTILCWGVGLFVCLCARSACTQPLLAGVRGVGVCVWARVSAAPRHCWLGCALWVCVLGLGFWLRPATPDWGVGLCVCSCARSACTLPLLAGVRGVGVCVWARVSAAPRHSWLGCWAVCVLVCALCLHPATPGTGARCGCVCLGSGFGCAPPLLAGVLGCLCAGVGAPLAPRDSWLGCAPWVCVFGLGIRLRPASPGWGVGVCVCWCGRSACTPPLLAWVRAVRVSVWARVSAAPRHAWLGCWAVCVLVCALRLHPATPGTGARCGCVCVWAWVSAAPRHSWLGCCWSGLFLSMSCFPLLSAGGVCCRRCPCLLCAVVCRGSLLLCAMSCGNAFLCGAVLWCPAVFFALPDEFVSSLFG